MKRVRCGWCPLLLPDDMTEWYHHFLIVHGFSGYSVRHDVAGSDWDVTELAEGETA